MTDRNLIFLRELCYIANKRNEINTRRHRARFKKNYYEHAVRVVEAHNDSNATLRYLNKGIKRLECDPQANAELLASMRSRRTDILWHMNQLRIKYLKHKKPLKWQIMGLHKLRSLVLKNEGEYALAKHDTMELSIRYRERIKFLLKELRCALYYNNGSITRIFFKGETGDSTINEAHIRRYAEEYQLNKAIDGMLK